MSTSNSMFCKGCWQHMRMPIPIRGPLSIPLRLTGVRISRMNPNLCTICETMFTKVKRKKHVIIPATVLFADIRNYTAMSESAPAEVAEMLHCFSDECAAAVWERDGIVNKFMGDAVLAVFNFPIMRDDHVQQAVLAAQEIQRRCAERKAQVAQKNGSAQMGVGIGIHTGLTSIGEVGSAYKDFTVIGAVVNLASRIQTAAKTGEILVSKEVYEGATGVAPHSQSRECRFKGVEEPVTVYSLAA